MKLGMPSLRQDVWDSWLSQAGEEKLPESHPIHRERSGDAEFRQPGCMGAKWVMGQDFIRT